ANRAKSQFLATMSHELRTPLNIILGFTQVMGRDLQITTKHREHLQTIIRSGNHLLSLINDVLDLSKIEAGRATLNESNCDFKELLTTLQSMFQLKATLKGLKLEVTIAPSVPQFIFIDASKLRQILINLLGNAIKFTQEGRVSLRVWAEEIQSGREEEPLASPQTHPLSSLRPMTLHLEVEDTGIGVPPEALEKIFDAFVQAQNGKQTIEGTGLGLAISRRFAQLMGGQIRVRSTLHQGSVFYLQLPIRASEKTVLQSESPQRSVIQLAPGQPRYRILIADDHPGNRNLLVSLLKSVGFDLLEASNGLQTIALWEQTPPHLILLDIHMPTMDGYEVARTIRQREESPHRSLAPTPMIALTANAFPETRDRALEAGCNEFLSKPFQESELFDKIAGCLGVQFLYQEAGPALEGQPEDTPFSVSDWDMALQDVSQEWLMALHHAALACDDEQVIRLVHQLPPEQAPLATAILQLAKLLQFEQLLQLTQPQVADTAPLS
ncbi:MAG: ATP-binding protein, partial [Leptolyngbyaceae cyanobacterium bins.59]|nr:ATP-binding protein [Leptolyngbyaceae cyanobacterium bins.59]